MTTSGRQRMQTYRQRRAAQGSKQYAMYLSPAAVVKLDQLREQWSHYTVGEIVSAVLTQQPLDGGQTGDDSQ